jgi:hypothetical protein
MPSLNELKAFEAAAHNGWWPRLALLAQLMLRFVRGQPSRFGQWLHCDSIGVVRSAVLPRRVGLYRDRFPQD